MDSKPAAGASERKMLDRVIEKLSKKDPHRIFQRPVSDDEVRHKWAEGLGSRASGKVVAFYDRKNPRRNVQSHL